MRCPPPHPLLQSRGWGRSRGGGWAGGHGCPSGSIRGGCAEARCAWVWGQKGGLGTKGGELEISRTSEEVCMQTLCDELHSHFV